MRRRRGSVKVVGEGGEDKGKEMAGEEMDLVLEDEEGGQQRWGTLRRDEAYGQQCSNIRD